MRRPDVRRLPEGSWTVDVIVYPALVVLLDKATSALDTESEKPIQGALLQAASSCNRITIAVAHRLLTVRDANCIFVFYAGKVVEAGTHSELIGKGGMYAKMCEAQKLDGTA
ncbi:ATP-binding cassette multidrug transport protein ATRC [Aspergillus nomiae NRRL 13137]|uniref:ATP-binding cassette multidrug transport protein ATRC n=1 Tax=Aspergillus nomiae NRRL (strain ATCC 15546 / NRRL 13137 / CBS 260.88 / M93) TaxID=1509407 RepID=A0A0L1J9X6_ASPN3|nr:ATP-binding cassette multidrug transport protein ATRC [Aspergillus nomiae NRRL 13137]KNG88544.1 ATP-binding cassette multidrug transport protein ATRC [Aspergillus nomiae NRRL 13137]